MSRSIAFTAGSAITRISGWWRRSRASTSRVSISTASRASPWSAARSGTAGWKLSGWAAVRSGGVREVQVRLDDRHLGTFLLTEPRPDVAERMGESALLAGWAGSCPLPEGSYRAASVLRVGVVDARGELHPLFAGPVEAALLESSRNEAVGLGRARLEEQDRFYKQEAWLWNQKKELEVRLAAMEASRFWRIRDAWFGLKRRLGLTRDP